MPKISAFNTSKSVAGSVAETSAFTARPSNKTIKISSGGFCPKILLLVKKYPSELKLTAPPMTKRPSACLMATAESLDLDLFMASCKLPGSATRTSCLWVMTIGACGFNKLNRFKKGKVETWAVIQRPKNTFTKTESTIAQIKTYLVD